ncbi:MAG: hypothetical protein AB8B74_03225 [Crocinitomicaceae bacterium]
MSLKALLLAFLILTGTVLSAQGLSDTISAKNLPVVKITKNDKKVLIGQMVQDNGRHIVLRMKDSVDLYIVKTEIKSLKFYQGENGLDAFRKVMPYRTRYYYTSNALPLKKGENYANIHLYGPEFHVALSNRFSIGFMGSWIASPLGLALKYAIPTKNEKINLSINNIGVSSGYLFYAKAWGGLHTVTITFGQADRNVSISSGIGYSKLDFEGWSKINSNNTLRVASVTSIAGTFPVNDKLSFIFDSMFAILERKLFSEYHPGFISTSGFPFNRGPILYRSGTEVSSFIMPGLRFQNGERKAFQFGIMGLVQYSSIGFTNFDPNPDIRMVPIPVLSWLFKI